MRFRFPPRLLAALLALPASLAALSNERITADFNDRGLALLRDDATRAVWHFTGDDFSLTVGGRLFDSGALAAPTRRNSQTAVTYSYAAGGYKFEVVYELRPDWRFLSKQIVITAAPPGAFRLEAIAVFRDSIAEPVRDAYVIARERRNLGTADYGACLRFDRSRGLLVTAQNPFLSFRRDGGQISLLYKPEMDWDIAWGPFAADRGLLAPYQLSGHTQPEHMLPEWQIGSNDAKPGMDDAEIETFTELVRAFLLYHPGHPLNIMIGWCANDYQIDIATAQGRAEYKRILDMAAALNADHVLFAPTNSALSRRADNRDDWGWEQVLWLGLGQKIRQNQWDPATGAIPASVQEMLDYARAKKLGLVAYVYPVMPFAQNPAWLVSAHGTRANLGVRALQDWLIAALEGFYRHTGISGYAFDHTFLNLDGASRYAQWWGWRRILETLRRDIPDIVIDGRQAYQNYGPWTWLAGSYPHPTSTDEQPESFNTFPDLHADRVSADRERYTAWRYREYEFAPSEIVPGFITHQTGRNDDSGHMPSAKVDGDDVPLPFRRRDWDYLGWRYSLLSSIAIAGWNNVINMIPARDVEEFKNFSEADREFFRHWIDFADMNKEYLLHTRPILGPPAIGSVDGTAAFVDDGGYIFLFNPNGRRMEASVTLDESLGLKLHGSYLVRELYPQDQRLIGKPGAGAWSWGDAITREMDGGSAVVLQVERSEEVLTRSNKPSLPSFSRRETPLEEPVLFNAPGSAVIDGRVLRLSGIRGEAGTSEILQIAVPESAKVSTVEMEGSAIPARPSKSGMIEIPVLFQGTRFHQYQQVDSYRRDFAGGTVTATFSVPRRVFEQLAARRKAWPIPWTDEDRRSTWLAPDRLLLYVQFAEPDDRWQASLEIDGRTVELVKAYDSVRPNRRNFSGFYADVSGLAPDVEHKLELRLPSGLKPGQYQGVFFENVETKYTAPQVKSESRP